MLAGGAVAAAFIPVFAGYRHAAIRKGLGLGQPVITIAAGYDPISLLLMLFAPGNGVAYAGWDEPRQLLAGIRKNTAGFPGNFRCQHLRHECPEFLQPILCLAGAGYVQPIYDRGALVLAEPLGIYGLAIGAAAGAFMHLLVQLPGLVQVRMQFRPALDLAHEGVREVGRLMVPRMLGLGVIQASLLVNVVLASWLEEGSLAYLDYAWLLTMLPLGIFAMAISTAVFPTLAEQSALDRFEELRNTFLASLRLILYLTIPCSVGLLLLGEPIVRLLLQRGDFTPEATSATAYALSFFALGLAGHATIEIVNRFYAPHDTRTPVAVAFCAFLLNAQ